MHEKTQNILKHIIEPTNILTPEEKEKIAGFLLELYEGKPLPQMTRLEEIQKLIANGAPADEYKEERISLIVSCMRESTQFISSINRDDFKQKLEKFKKDNPTITQILKRAYPEQTTEPKQITDVSELEPPVFGVPPQ